MTPRESASRRRTNRPDLAVTSSLTAMPDHVVGDLGDLIERMLADQARMHAVIAEIEAALACPHQT